MSDVLDGRIQDFLREVVCTNIAADREGITASCLDLVNDSLCLLLVQTACRQSRDIVRARMGDSHTVRTRLYTAE